MRLRTYVQYDREFEGEEEVDFSVSDADLDRMFEGEWCANRTLGTSALPCSTRDQRVNTALLLSR